MTGAKYKELLKKHKVYCHQVKRDFWGGGKKIWIEHTFQMSIPEKDPFTGNSYTLYKTSHLGGFEDGFKAFMEHIPAKYRFKLVDFNDYAAHF